ncbi:MAG: hypothetical protein ACRDOY_02620 [Nocardioidaceae bacterium]
MSTTPSPRAHPMLTASFAGLVDDAAIFPPGDAPMPEAVRDHAAHLNAWYAPAVGAFVCSDARLPELQRALEETELPGSSPLRLNVTITGGAGAVEPALTWVRRDPRLALNAVEVALRDEADLAHNAARMTTVLAQSLPDDVSAFVELPRLHGSSAPASWQAALAEVAAAGHPIKLRTGGLEPDAFPTSAELCTLISAALDQQLEFKCTAGLHFAVRHTATDTGFEHHGFLNVLLATRALLDGADPAAVVAELEERDPASVADRVGGLGDDTVTSTRRWFRSVGSCSVAEPVGDLVRLGLLADGAVA